MNKPGFPTMSTLDIGQVMETIPHRYPMLLVDRVEDIIADESAVGIKNVTINEPFFQGHFPDHPVMPGVLIVEAMAQTAACLVMYSLGDEARDKIVYFMSIDQARFRRPVQPGVQLRIPVIKQRRRGMVWKYSCSAQMDNDTIAAEAIVTAMLRDR